MSGYAAGRMAEGALKIAAWITGGIAAIVAVISLFGGLVGPVASAVIAGSVVYICASILSQSLISRSGMRLGTIPGAAIAAWCGVSLAGHMGGFLGAITGAVVTMAGTAILMPVLGLLAQSIYSRVTGKK